MRDANAALRCRSLGSYEGKKFDWADGFILLALHGLLTNHHNWLTLFSLFSAKDDKFIPTYRHPMQSTQLSWSFYPRFFHDWLIMSIHSCVWILPSWWARTWQMSFQIWFVMFIIGHLWSVKRAGGPSNTRIMGTLERQHSYCANIYKLVRQYFAPCLFNQEADAAIC